MIANLIQCQPDTPRLIGTADVFAIQEGVIEDILRSSREQQAAQTAPKVLDPIQHTVTTMLRGYLNTPKVDRKEARRLIQFVEQPMPGAYLKAVKAAYQAFAKDQGPKGLIKTLKDPQAASGTPARDESLPRREIRREDLHLVCFDYVWS